MEAAGRSEYLKSSAKEDLVGVGLLLESPDREGAVDICHSPKTMKRSRVRVLVDQLLKDFQVLIMPAKK